MSCCTPASALPWTKLEMILSKTSWSSARQWANEMVSVADPPDGAAPPPPDVEPGPAQELAAYAMPAAPTNPMKPRRSMLIGRDEEGMVIPFGLDN